VLSGLGALAMMPAGGPSAPALERARPAPESAAPKVGKDRHGAALPAGAIARLGTVRLRALCDSLAFTPDGKALVGVDGGALVRVWAAADGDLRQVRSLGRQQRWRWPPHTARSPDGKTLLVWEGEALELWDVPSGKRLDVPLPKGLRRLERVALSDDRKLLLSETVKERIRQEGGGIGFEQQQSLLFWDVRKGKMLVLARDESQLVGLAFSPDGELLASSSYRKGTCVWDAAGGKLLWQVPRFNAEMVAFTPDGKHLVAAPGGGQNRWHVWDAATGKASKTLRPPTIGYVWRFALSPDGSKLVAPTHTDYVLWCLRTGKVLHRWPGANQAGKCLFSPDGRSVVTHLTRLQRWDVATGKPLYADVSPLGHTAAVRRLLFTPDGKRLVSTGEDGTIRTWDVAGARPLHTARLGPVPMAAWALTPDGGVLVGVDEKLTLRRWCVTDGRALPDHELREAKALDIGLRACAVRVTPDGKELVVSAWPRQAEYRFRPYSFSAWSAQTGRHLRWGGNPGDGYRGEYYSLSPDGRLAAGQGELIDTRTGRRRVPLPGHESNTPPVFSPDGRLLAGDIGRHDLRVWEAATGAAVLDLPAAEIARAAAFSPEGAWLACVEPRKVTVYDLRMGKKALERVAEDDLRENYHWVSSDVVFAPDGRAFATGHLDGTILLWGLPAVRESSLTAVAAASLWEALARRDGRGQKAVWRLQECPGEAVRALGKRLRPVPHPSPEELKRLIDGLGGDEFETREAARQRLEAIGRAAAPALRQALAGRPGLEPRRRLEAILKVVTREAPPEADDLRALRAVAVLEGANTAAARRLLGNWARGEPEAPLTREAKAALERLGRRGARP
jgi:WD40 repeat protein